MVVADLIKELESATGPSRHLDARIALLVGYKRKTEYATDSQSGERTRRVLWIIPGGKDPARVPRYTQNIDAALILLQSITSESVGGFSWDEKGGYARIGAGPYCSGANSAIALCIAALHIKAAQL